MKIMVITYFGDGCFRLQSGETSCLIDPVNNRLKADVVLRTSWPTDASAPLQNEIAYPGEYELKGLEIQGISLLNEASKDVIKTAYAVRFEDVQFAVFGRLQKMPEPEVLEKTGEPDIVMLPCDGDHMLAPEQAVKIAHQLEPRIIITTASKHYKDFLKVFGQKAEPQEKFVFKKKELASEKGRVIILQASGA